MVLEKNPNHKLGLKRITLGIMQGRLLPKYKDRYQAHPVGMWQEEFQLAANCGLSSIEFILDFEDFEKNPLIYSGGGRTIANLCRQTGVQVRSICADYFMQSPLIQEDTVLATQAQSVLEHLICTAPTLGVQHIVIPCIENSALTTPAQTELFVQRLKPALRLAERHSVNLALETDLAPAPFAKLLRALNSPRATVNYDIGNSAALGFDVSEELAHYAPQITDIHIKDRVLNGFSVELGTGNAQFPAFFKSLSKVAYEGLFILQAFRDAEGVAILKRQLAWIAPLLRAYEKTLPPASGPKL